MNTILNRQGRQERQVLHLKLASLGALGVLGGSIFLYVTDSYEE
jgi:hypothetical protein